MIEATFLERGSSLNEEDMIEYRGAGTSASLCDASRIWEGAEAGYMQ